MQSFLSYLILLYFSVAAQPQEITKRLGCATEIFLQGGHVTQGFNLTQGNNEVGMVYLTKPVNLTQGFAAPLRVNLGKDGAGTGMTLLLATDTFVPFPCGDTTYLNNYLNSKPTYIAIHIETSEISDNIRIQVKEKGSLTLDQTVSALTNGGNIEDSKDHAFTLMWNEKDKEIIILWDGERRFCESLDLTAFLKNSANWYLGMGGSTGLLPDTQVLGMEQEPLSQCCPALSDCYTNLPLRYNAYPLGDPTLGQWRTDSSTQVIQKIQGGPTFFGLALELLDVEYRFQVCTPTTASGDIGFYIGTPPSCSKTEQFDMYLFRWRGAGATLCNGVYDGGLPGFLLAHVKGTIPSGCANLQTNHIFWQNPDIPGVFDVKSSQNSPSLAWQTSKCYDFRVVYRHDMLMVYMSEGGGKNKQLVAQLAGCFSPARFGFYTMNQAEVRFKNLSYNYQPAWRLSDTVVCVGETISSKVINRCQQGSEAQDLSLTTWNFGDGTTDRNFMGSHAYKDPGIYTVGAKLTDKNGCAADLYQEVTVSGAPPAPQTDTVPVACFGQASGKLLIHPPKNKAYMYSLDSINFKADTLISGLTAGAYRLHWQEVGGCKSDNGLPVSISQPDTFVVTAYIKETMRLGDTARTNLLVVPDGRVFTSTWSEDTQFLTCTRCPRPYFQPRDTGLFTFILTVTDTFGCTASDDVSINVTKRPNYVYVPNAFGINGNGYNETFTFFAGREVEEVTRFEVYNRWGNIVYKYDDRNGVFLPGDPVKGWNGLMQNTGHECPLGVYVYFIQYRLINGQQEERWGDVLLVR